MNLSGSSRALCNNSKAAILAAIEIYNKPQMEYRDECFTILLINAWELLIKAILSKYKQRIYYPKKRNEPYRTLSIQDAMRKVRDKFPTNIQYEPVVENINMLVTYRNNAIHFYNQKAFSIIIYGLAQTSIINFRDLMLSIFKVDLANEITVYLLPLSFGRQPDPVEFIQTTKDNPPKNRAVAYYLKEISDITLKLEAQKQDTARFLTVFDVSLKSVKKVSAADVVVGINNAFDKSDPVIIEKRVDPNLSHPNRQKDVLKEIGNTLAGLKFSQYTFQAIVRKYNIREKLYLCWRADSGELTRYSNDIFTFLKQLTKSDIQSAIADYRQYLREKKRKHSN